MNQEALRRLLEGVARGEVGVEEALRRLAHLPFEDLGFARLDHHRALRRHFPEVIYGPGKTTDQLLRLVASYLEKGLPLLVTRVPEEAVEPLLSRHPELSYHEEARIVSHHPGEVPRRGLVAVVSGGTADQPVVEEARLCAELFGNRVEVFRDVGVAGVHRLFAVLDRLREARALIVVAGMEGALPSLVSGLVDRPVIAVPTSAGYGANFQGLAPLLAMLNSCSPGVAVVNIDNGFGAAYLASLINQLPEEERGAGP